MTSSQYGLYKLGYTRITMVVTKNSNSASWSNFLKNNLSSDWSLQVGTMKAESRVIANQHVAVNSLQLHDTPPVTPWKLVLVETTFWLFSQHAS
jgi:hypothetical protein